MIDWLKKRSELEQLKSRYTNLMKKSYDLALHDKEASDRINQEAKEVYRLIKDLESRN